MNEKEHIIKEIKKYKDIKNRIYARLAIAPTYVIAAFAAAIGGVYAASLGSDAGVVIGLTGIASTYYSLKNAAKTVDDYSFEVAEVSPDGPDDWVSHDPSLKEQLIEAKEQLTLLKAQLVELDREERKGKGR